MWLRNNWLYACLFTFLRPRDYFRYEEQRLHGVYDEPSNTSMSGLLTFTLYYLCKNPEAMRKVREEVDEVLGDQPIHVEDISKLKYVSGMPRRSFAESHAVN